MLFRAAADLVVVVHAAFVAFVVLGALLVLRWPRLVWVHVPAAAWGAFVECQGWICPLTPLENYLRQRGGSSAYQGEFIEHYLLPLLYPAHLTRHRQIWLGSVAIVINILLYWHVVQRGSIAGMSDSSSARGPRYRILKATVGVSLANRPSRSGHTPTLQLTTPAFKPAGDIPAKFTCDGSDTSPVLSWNTPPEATQSFALILDDPDAPGRTWVHWVVYDLPAAERELPEGVPTDGELPSGARQGRNDFGSIGYGGPCPPPGPEHRYSFTLYALDKRLELPAGATRAQLDRSMRGHILARAELMGRYRRK